MSVTTAVYAILALTVGVLFLSGNRSWQRTYASANRPSEDGVTAISTAFGAVGRKSNRLSYILYEYDGNVLTPALPTSSTGQEVVWGNAVEFRFWDVPLDDTDSYNLLDVTKIATAYALFYLDNDQLQVDYGPYPPGAAPEGGGARNTSGVKTQVLAENVSTETGVGVFSHTTISGVGQGTVRINVIVSDPSDGKTIKLMTATLLRNLWPR